MVMEATRVERAGTGAVPSAFRKAPEEPPAPEARSDEQTRDASRRVRPIFEHLAEIVDNDWQSVVKAGGSAAGQLADLTDRQGRLWARSMAATLTNLAEAGVDKSLVDDVDVAAYDLLMSTFDRAIVLGYSLARTWPTSLDQLAHWPQHAVDFTDTDIEADRFNTLKAIASPRSTPPSGETVGDVIRRSGSVPNDDPAERAAQAAMQSFLEFGKYRDVDARILALGERGEAISIEEFNWIDDRHTDQTNDAVWFAAAYAYELAESRAWGLPEVRAQERALARARSTFLPRR